MVHAGKAAPAAIVRRKSSKEFFAMFKPISQSPKPQAAPVAPAPAAEDQDQPQQSKKLTRRIVIDSDSE